MDRRRQLGLTDTGFNLERQRTELAERSGRSLVFCQELAAALRARLDPTHEALGATLGELEGRLAAWGALLASLERKSHDEALTALRGVNAIAVMRDLRAFEAAMAAAAAPPPAGATDARPDDAQAPAREGGPPAAGGPPSRTAPLPASEAARRGSGPLAAPAPGGLVGKLKQLWRDAEAQAAAPARPATGSLQAKPGARIGTGELEVHLPGALAEAIALARRVTAYVVPRAEVFRDALTILAGGHIDSTDARHASWAGAVANALAERPDDRRRVSVVLTQLDAALSLLEEAETAASVYRLGRGTDMRFDPRRLRGTVVPLGHLHVTFKDTPTVCALFPPPPPRPVERPPSAAPRTGRLNELL